MPRGAAYWPPSERMPAKKKNARVEFGTGNRHVPFFRALPAPGAAWDATALGPRDSHRRAGLQGRAGLRHGRAELHLPALRSSQQPRAGRGGLQPRRARQLDLVLGLQRHVPMPNGPCKAVALLEDNAARLSWLHETCLSSLNWESDAEEVSYLLLVDYDFPPELHDHLDWAPPARMKVGKGLYGPHTADMAGKRLKFLRDVLRQGLHRAYRFACSPFMAGFMELKDSETAGSVVAENAIFGRCCMNPDKFRNTNAYVDPAKFERAVGKSSVTNFAHPSRRPHAAALQAHDGEGLLPPHEEALPEDEAALHGHRLRDGADLQAAGPAPRHGRGEPQRRRPLRRGRQVQGPEGPERTRQRCAPRPSR